MALTNYTEKALVIDCEGSAMLGVLSIPKRPPTVGLLIVVGGPQYRVGSHRQFVVLARRLAAEGLAVLRFDYRGMGDSDGEPRSFEDVQADIRTAIDGLVASCATIDKVLLWGLCDGASAALMYVGATKDPRVVGLCLLNLWVRSEDSLARTHLKHHYAARALQPEFWKKLASGRFDWRRSLSDLLANLKKGWDKPNGQAGGLSFHARMAQAMREFSGPVLLILSGADYTAKEFVERASTDRDWHGLLQQANVTRVDLEGADHTFSRLVWRQESEQAVVNWLVGQQWLPASAKPQT